MPRLAPAALLALVVALAGGSRPPLARAAGPYDGLLAALPPESNCLVLVDVRAAFASPLAQSDRWSADIASRYRSGVGFVPPDALRLAIASQVNLSAMTRDVQVGLVAVQQPPMMRTLAEREGGFASDLAGQTVALSPRNVYFANLPGAVIAAVYPADRQATARWLRHAAARTPADLGPYLTAAAGAAGGHTVTIAVNLTDSVDPALMRLSLPSSPTIVRTKGLDLAALSRQLGSVRGLTFTADVTDAVAASVRVDFAFDPTPFRGVLRDLFLELLADQGAVIPGVESWEAKYDATGMTLSGPLAGPDLRRVLSLFAFPGAPGEEAPAGPEKASPTLTRQYLAAVELILADIRRIRDDKGYDKTATWHDKAAEQLLHLNRRGVDPAAVEAAEAAAGRLHAIAGSLRGVPIRADELGKTAYFYSARVGGLFGAWNPFAPSFVQSNVPEVQAKIAKVVEEDKQKRAELWAQIDQAVSGARNALREKYKEKF